MGSGDTSRKREEQGGSFALLLSTTAPSTCRQVSDPSPGGENRELSHRGVRAAARWVGQARRHHHGDKHWAERVWTGWQSTGGADPGPSGLTTQMGLQGKPLHSPARSPSLCGCSPQERRPSLGPECKNKQELSSTKD